ncbi:hypothetical protein [Desulfosudis oleivorans]|uniref:hypothetical protein n=1 Tax=Desulfosudis oleivorans TaxID=181663 RepID=UPI0012947DBB|nr:hypothetical protein [Desulfosudis oleivorans]
MEIKAIRQALPLVTGTHDLFLGDAVVNMLEPVQSDKASRKSRVNSCPQKRWRDTQLEKTLKLLFKGIDAKGLWRSAWVWQNMMILLIFYVGWDIA